MGDKSKIEWTQSTWNFLAGCAKVSEECRYCYAMTDAHRMGNHPNEKVRALYEGLTKNTSHGPEWTGKVRITDAKLELPIHWTKPRRIFVNSMSDLFHPDVPFEVIAAAFGVMAATSRHTYQILTKRPARMLEFFSWLDSADCPVTRCMHHAIQRCPAAESKIRNVHHLMKPAWPLANVWLGISAGTQKSADEFVPLLLQVPAVVRFISAEPLLGPLDLRREWGAYQHGNNSPLRREWLDGIQWVIVGGESGSDARPMHPEWARSLRDQCHDAGVPFLFKQWGAWAPSQLVVAQKNRRRARVDGSILPADSLPQSGDAMLAKLGKKLTGRDLDGEIHDGYPEPCASGDSLQR